MAQDALHYLIGGGWQLGWVAIKALLLYLTAVFGFRLGKRRALAEMSPFDFVAAVAVGAIVGRVPNSVETSYLAGSITLVTILVAHSVITHLRFFPALANVFDHSPRLLVAHGKVVDRELLRAGLTLSDLYGLLRQNGLKDLSEARFVIFENRGNVSIVPETEQESAKQGLVRDIVERTSSQL